jgi:hypothetical protein
MTDDTVFLHDLAKREFIKPDNLGNWQLTESGREYCTQLHQTMNGIREEIEIINRIVGKRASKKETLEQFVAIRREAGRQIDPETCEIEWRYADDRDGKRVDRRDNCPTTSRRLYRDNCPGIWHPLGPKFFCGRGASACGW